MIAPDLILNPQDVDFAIEIFGNITVDKKIRKVSEWAEQSRYLPSELTSLPGKFKCSVTPYLTEIMNQLGPDSSARKIVVRKGKQVGCTTGILENAIGFWIAEDPSGIMYISADAGLTKQGMELKISRMLHHSGLAHLLGPPDPGARRSGDTSGLKEFPNGFLLAAGAKSAGKLRQTSVKRMVLDEVDAYPLLVGAVGREEGSPIDVAEARTDTFETTRKILYLSTPLKTETSVINELFLAGDQRYYMVPCHRCGYFQALDWHGVREDGNEYGIVFDLDDDGDLIESSVAYRCVECQDLFYNHDKSWFLPRGHWEATSKSSEIGLVSYHLPTFYSPPGQQSWAGVTQRWLAAWDVKNDRMKSPEKLSKFYNLERGLPWTEQGESPTRERVMQNRRLHYSSGQVPNKMAIAETGAPIVALVCAIDVHKTRLDILVLGFCVDRQVYAIEWMHIEGDPDTPEVWSQVAELVEEKRWVADDGRIYGLTKTLIDANYQEKAEAVHRFCGGYSQGVYAIVGRRDAIKEAVQKEFTLSKTAGGHPFFNIWTSFYKDRFTANAKVEWLEGQLQPQGKMNFPEDFHDDFFSQLTAEAKFRVTHSITKKTLGFEWRAIKQRPNHSLDCFCYCLAAFDMLVYGVCLDLGLETLNYSQFFDFAAPRQNTTGTWLQTPFSYHPGEVLR